MTERRPATEAGRAHFAKYHNSQDATDDILAIEAQAAAAAVREADALRAALRHIADGDLTARNPREIARVALSATEPAAGEREP